MDPARLKDYALITKIDNMGPDRALIGAEVKHSKAEEKRAQAEYKRDKAKNRLEEMAAKKQLLLEQIAAKKAQLYALANDSKDAQNRALKLPKSIQGDKDAHLKLGALQQFTIMAQVALKGYQPDQLGSAMRTKTFESVKGTADPD